VFSCETGDEPVLWLKRYGHAAYFAHMPLPELEAEAAVTRMGSERPTMTEERVIPLSFLKVSGLAHRGPKRPKAAESQHFDEDRMWRQLRDARQRHAGRLRLLTKSEMPCTQVSNSRREPRAARIGAYFKEPEEVVSDILFTWRTVTLGVRLHSLMAYSDWRRVSECQPVFSRAEWDAYDCSDELHLEGVQHATATHFKETVAFAKYVLGAYGSLAFLASVRAGRSSMRSLVCGMMLRQRDPFRVVRTASRERPFADEGEPWCSGKCNKVDSDTTKTLKYAVSRLKKQMLDNPAMDVKGAGWFPSWLDPRAARWMKFSDDQAWMPYQLADDRWSAQMFAGCVVAASLVLSVSLPLAAASLARLSRCFMAAALLRQAVTMPHGRRLLGACCVVAFGCSRFGAICLLMKAFPSRWISRIYATTRSNAHALACPRSWVYRRRSESFVDTTPAPRVKWCCITRETRSLIRCAQLMESLRWFAIVLSFLMHIGGALLQRRQSKLGNVVTLMLQLMLMSPQET
jgi:hypothetical protein